MEYCQERGGYNSNLGAEKESRAKIIAMRQYFRGHSNALYKDIMIMIMCHKVLILSAVAIPPTR